jgi:sec-independent protein translocase protein TatA
MLDITLAFGLTDVGGGEILLIGLIALLLFGKNLPTVMRNVGKAYGSFKNTLNEASNEFKREMDAAASEIEAAKREVDVEGELKETLDEAANMDSTSDAPALTAGETDSTTDSTAAPTFTPPTTPAEAVEQGPSSLDTAAASRSEAATPHPLHAPVSADVVTADSTTPGATVTPVTSGTPEKTLTNGNNGNAPKPKPAVSTATSLDQLEKRIAAPKKIPPPLS